jgi:Cu2+-exporting ATPase
LALAEKMVAPSLVVGGLALPLYGFSSAVAALSAMPGVDMYFAGPLALLNFLHVATNRGILIKDGRALELLQTVDTVIFDKTGTLTLEQPEVVQIHRCHTYSADTLLAFAAAAEAHQSHPMAQAILRAAQQRNLTIPAGDDQRYEVGFGVQIGVDGHLVRVGSLRFMTNEGITIPATCQPIQQHCAAIGHSLVFVAVGDRVAGMVELQPTIRPEASAIIADLKARGLKLYILSGDQVEPTRHLAASLGIDAYFANVLPESKAQFVEQIQQEGRTVCFVGDGINDALALKKAQVSVSLRGATTLATDTAQIVLMSGDLHNLPLLFDLAHRLERNLLTSFGLSIATGGVIIGGVFAFHLGVGAAVGIGAVALIGILGNALMPLLLTIDDEEQSSQW